jgi:hypothetical protein
MRARLCARRQSSGTHAPVGAGVGLAAINMRLAALERTRFTIGQ